MGIERAICTTPLASSDAVKAPATDTELTLPVAASEASSVIRVASPVALPIAICEFALDAKRKFIGR